MSGLDLLRARANFAALAHPSVSLCRRLGLEWAEVEAHAGGVFLAPIRPTGSYFDFDADGVEAAVVEARGVDDWTVVDLVAWVPAVPDRWFVAIGAAPALGLAHGFNPASYYGGVPLQLHRTPEQWIVEKCHGSVLLDLDAGVEWLSGLPLATTIAVRDDAHGRQIDTARRRLGLSCHQRLVVPLFEAREVA